MVKYIPGTCTNQVPGFYLDIFVNKIYSHSMNDSIYSFYNNFQAQYIAYFFFVFCIFFVVFGFFVDKIQIMEVLYFTVCDIIAPAKHREMMSKIRFDCEYSMFFYTGTDKLKQIIFCGK